MEKRIENQTTVICQVWFMFNARILQNIINSRTTTSSHVFHLLTRGFQKHYIALTSSTLAVAPSLKYRNETRKIIQIIKTNSLKKYYGVNNKWLINYRKWRKNISLVVHDSSCLISCWKMHYRNHRKLQSKETGKSSIVELYKFKNYPSEVITRLIISHTIQIVMEQNHWRCS